MIKGNHDVALEDGFVFRIVEDEVELVEELPAFEGGHELGVEEFRAVGEEVFFGFDKIFAE